MTFDYAASAATATRLLTQFGAACTLHRRGAGTYNPATGTSTPVETPLATTAAVFAYPQSYIDGTLIKGGDLQAFMAPAVEPAQGDSVTWGGQTLAVVAVKPLAPSGVAVLYEAQLRAG